MKSIHLTINNKSGLHARPASLFVNEANKFSSEIMVIKDKDSYNAKSIFSVLSMGAVAGSRVTITAEGEDENEAISSLETLINNNFGE